MVLRGNLLNELSDVVMKMKSWVWIALDPQCFSLVKIRWFQKWFTIRFFFWFNFDLIFLFYFHRQGFNITHAGSRLIAMVKPAYKAICRLSPRKPVIVFVPSRKQSKITALDLLSFCGAENQPQRYRGFILFFVCNIFSE